MIIDAVMAPLLQLVTWLVDLLPDYEMGELPGVTSFLQWVAELDSLVPIAAPMRAMVLLLALVTPFLVIRLVLWVRHIVLP